MKHEAKLNKPEFISTSFSFPVTPALVTTGSLVPPSDRLVRRKMKMKMKRRTGGHLCLTPDQIGPSLNSCIYTYKKDSSDLKTSKLKIKGNFFVKKLI